MARHDICRFPGIALQPAMDRMDRSRVIPTVQRRTNPRPAHGMSDLGSALSAPPPPFLSSPRSKVFACTPGCSLSHPCLGCKILDAGSGAPLGKEGFAERRQRPQRLSERKSRTIKKHSGLTVEQSTPGWRLVSTRWRPPRWAVLWLCNEESLLRAAPSRYMPTALNCTEKPTRRRLFC